MAIPGPTQWHIAVGNINLDISLVLDKHPIPDTNTFAKDAWIGLGGAASNYAIAVAKLGHRASLVARAGVDAVRLGLLSRLEREGVDISHVEIAYDEPLGMVIVLIIPRDSTRTMITIRGANEGLRGDLVPVGKGDHIHFSSTSPRILIEAEGRIEGRSVSYDPGGEAYRDPEGVVKAANRVADIILLNEYELRSLTGESDPLSATTVIGGRTRVVVVKHGRGGASLVADDEAVTVKAPPVPRVVDVTGAGDAFDAAFIIWYKSGAGLSEALRAAVAAGSAKVTLKGSSNMPSLSDVLEYLKATPKPRKIVRGGQGNA